MRFYKIYKAKLIYVWLYFWATLIKAFHYNIVFLKKQNKKNNHTHTQLIVNNDNMSSQLEA